MWPFKRKLKISFEDFAATQPPAPCGNQVKHVFAEVHGLKCHVCAILEREQDENRLAEKIAAAVMRLLANRE